MSGKVITAVQSVVNPNAAPAVEYVPIPDGSSSAAPVISPGPSCRKNRRIALRGRLVFAFANFVDLKNLLERQLAVRVSGWLNIFP